MEYKEALLSVRVTAKPLKIAISNWLVLKSIFQGA